MNKLINLNNLKPQPGAKHKEKRVGRGHGSGHGKTSCRGHKGQKSRKGLDIAPYFEGGQTPLIRRIPKRGFTNPFKVEYAVVNLKKLAQKFSPGEVVDYESLVKRGLVKKNKRLIKILGEGEIAFPLILKVHAISNSAREKIEKAGGKVEILK
ncbi:MAG: 50S ribosomal protein L15 [Thermodesulfobacterium sp.]|nr:50S ribosomal protein L15 [Thermodesulfobacterium sp.]